MILLWSPHNSGPVQRVLRYLLAPEITATIGGQRERIRRDPAPELLRGCAARVTRVIAATEARRTYTCATLSFAKNEVDIAMWQRGDPDTRCRIDAAIDLWCETAYPGIAPAARPPILVGTHLHTGRLEINILVPACLLLERGGRLLPRSYNVQLPCKRRDDPWVAYQDALNHAFGWHDPGDASNAAAVRGPSWIEKRASQIDRWAQVNLKPPGKEDTDSDAADRIAAEDPRVQILLAARILARTGARDRDALLAGLAPVLDNLGWCVDRLDEEATHLAGGPRADQQLVLRGTRCAAAPPVPRQVEIAARAHVRANATNRLARLSSARAATHAARYPGLPTAELAHPADILARPCPAAPPLSVRLRRLVAALRRRLADGIRLDAILTALHSFAVRQDGFAAPRLRPARGGPRDPAARHRAACPRGTASGPSATHSRNLPFTGAHAMTNDALHADLRRLLDTLEILLARRDDPLPDTIDRLVTDLAAIRRDLVTCAGHMQAAADAARALAARQDPIDEIRRLHDRLDRMGWE